MAKIRNTSGEDRLVPALGWVEVKAGAVVEVDDDDLAAYTDQVGIWAPSGAETKKKLAHEPAEQAEG